MSDSICDILSTDQRTARVKHEGKFYIVKSVDNNEAQKEITGLERLKGTGIAPKLYHVCKGRDPNQTTIIMEYIEGDV